MSYDPTDCELGICGPCDRCIEQIERAQEEADHINAMPDPRGDSIELGDEIPEGMHVSNPKRCQAQVAQTGNPHVDTCNARVENGKCSAGCDDDPLGTKKPIVTIDCTPSWVAVVSIYLEVIADPDAREQAQKDARTEILRAAKLADLYVKEHKR